MTPIEAYELTLKKIDEFKKEGIQVEIIPSKSRQDQTIIDEYKDHFQRIPFDKWINVTFMDLSEDQAKKINEVSNRLGDIGISFDTGGIGRSRDWELDWSFKFTGEDENEWKERKNEVEDIIKQFNN